MRKNRVAMAVSGAVFAMTAALVPGTAHAAPPAAAAPVPSNAALAQAAIDCGTGNVCFWTEYNFTGQRCAWSVADPDWQGGSIRCSWAATTNVKSVFNAGTSSATGVAYYLSTDYNNRIGCERQQHGANLAGTYKVRSHRWISGSCG
ncbi:peptidase inhibitor family I36 protein [Streptomyces sp. NPDC048349]|uniref:peptidase inhibitor family I36 protein n=1 Tax=Streptomyces sp. NPDC048349 TaxID=3155486 RepID=UPI003444138B